MHRHQKAFFKPIVAELPQPYANCCRVVSSLVVPSPKGHAPALRIPRATPRSHPAPLHEDARIAGPCPPPHSLRPSTTTEPRNGSRRNPSGENPRIGADGPAGRNPRVRPAVQVVAGCRGWHAGSSVWGPRRCHRVRERNTRQSQPLLPSRCVASGALTKTPCRVGSYYGLVPSAWRGVMSG